MAQGGRTIDSVCKFYIKVEDGGKIRAKCIKCSAMISEKAGRLRTQLEKCSQSESQHNFPRDDLPEILIPIKESSIEISVSSIGEFCIIIPAQRFDVHELVSGRYQPLFNRSQTRKLRREFRES